MKAWTIQVAESDAELERCLPVMLELRTNLNPQMEAGEFIAQVRRQEEESYRIVFLEADGEVRALAGYRLMHKLHTRKTLYVDDLVTRGQDRSKGYGEALINWLVTEARRQDCATFELDSGVQRFDAHRFYLRERMIISSHHFLLKLE